MTKKILVIWLGVGVVIVGVSLFGLSVVERQQLKPEWEPEPVLDSEQVEQTPQQSVTAEQERLEIEQERSEQRQQELEQELSEQAQQEFERALEEVEQEAEVRRRYKKLQAEQKEKARIEAGVEKSGPEYEEWVREYRKREAVEIYNLLLEE